MHMHAINNANREKCADNGVADDRHKLSFVIIFELSRIPFTLLCVRMTNWYVKFICSQLECVHSSGTDSWQKFIFLWKYAQMLYKWTSKGYQKHPNWNVYYYRYRYILWAGGPNTRKPSNQSLMKICQRTLIIISIVAHHHRMEITKLSKSDSGIIHGWYVNILLINDS